MCANVVAAFAKQLQELAFAFSRQQNAYLVELRKRDDRHKQFLCGENDDLVHFESNTSISTDIDAEENGGDSQPLTRAQKQALLEQDIEVSLLDFYQSILSSHFDVLYC